MAIFSRHRNERTLRCSDAHGKNAHASVSRFFCGFQGVTAQFFAVGEDDQSAISHGAFAEALGRKSNGARDICSAFGNRLGIQIAQGFNNGVVINRQRRLQKRAASKSDQTNTITLQLANQILDRELNSIQPVRLDVIGQHAAR